MRRASLALVLIFLAVYLLPLGVRPLFSPDETRYAEIPREMLVSGDWVVPHLNGVRYFEKPPLAYWVVASSLHFFGQNDFAARLPSALAAALTAIIVGLLAGRGSGRRLVGPLAAAVYLSSLLVFVVGTVNTLDGYLTLFLTGVLASLFEALQSSSPGRRRRFLALAGLCCGLAFLTKGFLALAIPVMVVLPFLVWQRRGREIPRLAGLPAVVALAVALPWSLAIHLREPDFWRYFFWVEHVHRFLDPQSASHHPEPFWYYAPLLAASQILWLPLLAAVVVGLRARRGRTELTRFALLWAALPFAFLSVSAGKLPTYILPCLAPLAILVAIGLADYVERERSPDLFFFGALASAGIALTGGLLIVSRGRAWYGDQETWKWLLLLAGLVVWSLASATAAFAGPPGRRLSAYCLAPALCLFAAPWAVPGVVEQEQALTSPGLGSVAASAIVVADSRTVHAVCWNLGRSDLRVLTPGGELAYGFGYPDARNRLMDEDELNALVTDETRVEELVLIISKPRYAKIVESSLLRTPPASASETPEMVWARYPPRAIPVGARRPTTSP